MDKHNALKLVFMAVSLCLVVVMAVLLFPLVREVVTNTHDESNIVDFVEAYGVRGAPILVGLSALQVIVPFIPAPAVGVLTGLCYGIFWGPVIFLAGCVLGNLFVFVFVRQLGGMFTLHLPHRKHEDKHKNKKKFLSKEKIEKLKRPEIVAFFLFLIPGPSGMIPYLFAETKVSLPKYLAAVVAGSLPSALVYVFLGERISSGNYTTAVIGAAVVVVALLVLLLFRKKIMGKVMSE